MRGRVVERRGVGGAAKPDSTMALVTPQYFQDSEGT